MPTAEPTWLTLPPLGEEISDELKSAMESFDAGERPAARAATSWLRDQALSAYETSRTRVLVADGQVAGFYALASSQVALRQRDRRRLAFDLAVVQIPAALVTWIARDKRAAVEGRTLLLHAVATARRASALQATAVLAVDPFDEETDEMWRKAFGFRPSSEPGTLKRLWLPLRAVVN
jgi:hypothetical protein